MLRVSLALFLALLMGSGVAAADDGDRGWFVRAAERSRRGDFAGALDAYEQHLGQGDIDGAILSNAAEMLMATGRLDEAIERYREAVALAERAGEDRAHIQDIVLASLGLAVALDRDERVEAARAVMARVLALDPGMGVLSVALAGDATAAGDMFFLPRGDVYAYLGLAREAQGRVGDARAAFRDYIARAGGGAGREAAVRARYVARARAHLTALDVSSPGVAAAVPAEQARAGARVTPRGRWRFRVAHESTLQAEGPLVAPMVDAAWRLAGPFLDACLSSVQPVADAAGAPRPFEVGLALVLDEEGRTRAATALLPREADPALGPCLEQALRDRFRVPKPAHRKATRVKMELGLAPVEPRGL